jgi:hypothetical protein
VIALVENIVDGQRLPLESWNIQLAKLASTKAVN